MIGEMRDAILKKVRQSGYFAIRFDETIGMSKIEQIAITVRYMAFENGKSVVKEDFVTFLSIFDVLKLILPKKSFTRTY